MCAHLFNDDELLLEILPLAEHFQLLCGNFFLKPVNAQTKISVATKDVEKNIFLFKKSRIITD